jgi:hypothetical protein
MRRTALRRSKPLARSSQLRAKPHADPVTPELWREVVDRDERRCMATVLDPSGHPPTSCRGKYGQRALVAIAPPLYDLSCLTVDHVPFPVHVTQRSKDDPARGTRRAPSRRENLLTLCHDANVNGWASAHRELERAHLATLYPEAWPDESG